MLRDNIVMENKLTAKEDEYLWILHVYSIVFLSFLNELKFTKIDLKVTLYVTNGLDLIYKTKLNSNGKNG